MIDGYDKAMAQVSLATQEVRAAAQFIREGLDAKDMDPITLMFHFVGEIKKSPTFPEVAPALFVVAVHHLVEAEFEVARLLKELETIRGTEGEEWPR